MANVTVVAAAVRAVAHDPEDTRTYDAASGYTPANGDLVAISGNKEVDKADATTAEGLNAVVGIVIAWKKTRTSAGAAGYRVTVIQRGLLEGFTGLVAGTYLYSSATAGRIEDADPTVAGTVGRVIGLAVNTTQMEVLCPALPGMGGES